MTSVFAVISNAPSVGSMKWFWNRAEAGSYLYDEIEANGDKREIKMYSLDVDHLIGEYIPQMIADGEATLLKEHKPSEPEKPEYTTLRYDTQDHNILYIERTFGGEFWAYSVKKRSKTSWDVKEEGVARIGRIYQDDPTALLPSYSVELRADQDPVAYGASLQEAVEKLIGTVSGDFGDVK